MKHILFLSFFLCFCVYETLAWIRFREPPSRRNFVQQTAAETLQKCDITTNDFCKLCGEGTASTSDIPVTNYTIIDRNTRILAIEVAFQTGLDGYLEFRLCNVTENGTMDAIVCRDVTPLLIGKSERWYPSSEQSYAQSRLRLPPELECERCVLQVKYTPGQRSVMANFRFFDCALLNISRPTVDLSSFVTTRRHTVKTNVNLIPGQASSGASSQNNAAKSVTREVIRNVITNTNINLVPRGTGKGVSSQNNAVNSMTREVIRNANINFVPGEAIHDVSSQQQNSAETNSVTREVIRNANINFVPGEAIHDVSSQKLNSANTNSVSREVTRNVITNGNINFIPREVSNDASSQSTAADSITRQITRNEVTNANIKFLSGGEGQDDSSQNNAANSMTRQVTRNVITNTNINIVPGEAIDDVSSQQNSANTNSILTEVTGKVVTNENINFVPGEATNDVSSQSNAANTITRQVTKNVITNINFVPRDTINDVSSQKTSADSLTREVIRNTNINFVSGESINDGVSQNDAVNTNSATKELTNISTSVTTPQKSFPTDHAILEEDQMFFNGDAVDTHRRFTANQERRRFGHFGFNSGASMFPTRDIGRNTDVNLRHTLTKTTVLSDRKMGRVSTDTTTRNDSTMVISSQNDASVASNGIVRPAGSSDIDNAVTNTQNVDITREAHIDRNVVTNIDQMNTIGINSISRRSGIITEDVANNKAVGIESVQSTNDKEMFVDSSKTQLDERGSATFLEDEMTGGFSNNLIRTTGSSKKEVADNQSVGLVQTSDKQQNNKHFGVIVNEANISSGTAISSTNTVKTGAVIVTSKDITVTDVNDAAILGSSANTADHNAQSGQVTIESTSIGDENHRTQATQDKGFESYATSTNNDRALVEAITNDADTINRTFVTTRNAGRGNLGIGVHSINDNKMTSSIDITNSFERNNINLENSVNKLSIDGVLNTLTARSDIYNINTNKTENNDTMSYDNAFYDHSVANGSQHYDGNNYTNIVQSSLPETILTNRTTIGVEIPVRTIETSTNAIGNAAEGGAEVSKVVNSAVSMIDDYATETTIGMDTKINVGYIEGANVINNIDEQMDTVKETTIRRVNVPLIPTIDNSRITTDVSNVTNTRVIVEKETANWINEQNLNISRTSLNIDNAHGTANISPSNIDINTEPIVGATTKLNQQVITVPEKLPVFTLPVTANDPNKMKLTSRSDRFIVRGENIHNGNSADTILSLGSDENAMLHGSSVNKKIIVNAQNDGISMSTGFIAETFEPIATTTTTTPVDISRNVDLTTNEITRDNMHIVSGTTHVQSNIEHNSQIVRHNLNQEILTSSLSSSAASDTTTTAAESDSSINDMTVHTVSSQRQNLGGISTLHPNVDNYLGQPKVNQITNTNIKVLSVNQQQGTSGDVTDVSGLDVLQNDKSIHLSGIETNTVLEDIGHNVSGKINENEIGTVANFVVTNQPMIGRTDTNANINTMFKGQSFFTDGGNVDNLGGIPVATSERVESEFKNTVADKSLVSSKIQNSQQTWSASNFDIGNTFDASNALGLVVVDVNMDKSSDHSTQDRNNDHTSTDTIIKEINTKHTIASVDESKRIIDNSRSTTNGNTEGSVATKIGNNVVWQVMDVDTGRQADTNIAIDRRVDTGRQANTNIVVDRRVDTGRQANTNIIVDGRVDTDRQADTNIVVGRRVDTGLLTDTNIVVGGRVDTSRKADTSIVVDRSADTGSQADTNIVVDGRVDTGIQANTNIAEDKYADKGKQANTNTAEDGRVDSGRQTEINIAIEKRIASVSSRGSITKDHLEMMVNGDARLNNIHIKRPRSTKAIQSVNEVPDVMPPIDIKVDSSVGINAIRDNGITNRKSLQSSEIVTDGGSTINSLLFRTNGTIFRNNGNVETLRNPEQISGSAIWDITRTTNDEPYVENDRKNQAASTKFGQVSNNDNKVKTSVSRVSSIQTTQQSTGTPSPRYRTVVYNTQPGIVTDTRQGNINSTMNAQVLRTLEALVLELKAFEDKKGNKDRKIFTTSADKSASSVRGADASFTTLQDRSGSTTTGRNSIHSSYPLFRVHESMLTLPGNVRRTVAMGRSGLSEVRRDNAPRGSNNHLFIDKTVAFNNRHMNSLLEKREPIVNDKTLLKAPNAPKIESRNVAIDRTSNVMTGEGNYIDADNSLNGLIERMDGRIGGRTNRLIKTLYHVTTTNSDFDGNIRRADIGGLRTDGNEVQVPQTREGVFQSIINVTRPRRNSTDLFSILSNNFASVSAGNKPSESGGITTNTQTLSLLPLASTDERNNSNITDQNGTSDSSSQQTIIDIYPKVMKQSVIRTSPLMVNPFSDITIDLTKHNDTFLPRGSTRFQNRIGLQQAADSRISEGFTPRLRQFQITNPNHQVKEGSNVAIEGKYFIGHMRRNAMGQFEPVYAASSMNAKGTSTTETKASPLDTATKQPTSANEIIPIVTDNNVDKARKYSSSAENKMSSTLTIDSRKTLNRNLNLDTLSAEPVSHNVQIITHVDTLNENTGSSRRTVQRQFFNQDDLLNTIGISLTDNKNTEQSNESTSCPEQEIFVCEAVGKNKQVPGMVWWCFSHCKNGFCPIDKCTCRCENAKSVIENEVLTATHGPSNDDIITKNKRVKTVVTLTLNGSEKSTVPLDKVVSESNTELNLSSRDETQVGNEKIKNNGNDVALDKQTVRVTSGSVTTKGGQLVVNDNASSSSNALSCTGINAFANTPGINEWCTEMCTNAVCPVDICNCL